MAQQAYRTVMVADDSGRVVYPLPGEVARPVPVWEETADGKRRPTDRQERDAATGLPLWEMTGMIRTARFGAVEPEMVTLRWASEDATSGAPL